MPRPAVLALVALVGVLSGCVPPWAREDTPPTAGPDRALAVPAESPGDGSAGGGDSADPSAAGTGTGAASGPASSGAGDVGTSPPEAESATPAAAAPVPRRLARLADRVGDAGLTAPGWADLVAVELIDTGSGHLEARVEVAEPIPTLLPAGEVAGIGLDLYVSGQSESDHQLFLQGSDEGWFAFVHTGGGFVPYRGTFRLDGARFLVTVPWDAISAAKVGELRVFADWSSRRAGLVALASQDHLPDRGRAPYG